MRICHLADTHWRGLARHAEYKRAFSAMFDDLRQNVKPDVIVIAGDIVHSKTQGISPELIDCLVWWFRELASICPVHVTLGNHDGALCNPQRQDAISPVINALDDPRVRLYKQSGVYRLAPGYNLCVFSVFDEEGWRCVYPVPGETNIATYHGSVRGCQTDDGWELEGDVDVSFFGRYDYVLLGDIHAHQFLAHRHGRPWVGYPGSSIMQSYGEMPGKGYLVWDIVDRDTSDVSFRRIPHDAEFRTIEWMGSIERTLAASAGIPSGTRVRVRSDSLMSHAEAKQLSAELAAVRGASEVVFKDGGSAPVVSQGSVPGGPLTHADLRDAQTVFDLIREQVGPTQLDDVGWARLREMTGRYIARATEDDETVRNVRWSIEDLGFDNILGYGPGNRIDFRGLSGITGIFGPNRAGKSSIIGALVYALFNGTDRGSIKNYHIINSRRSHCRVSMGLEANGGRYRLDRQSVKHETRAGVKHAVTSLNFARIDADGNECDLNGEQRTDTEKAVRQTVGSMEDYMMTGIAAQGDMNRFIDAGSSHRDQIIARFLDLVILEKMSAYARDDSNAIRAVLRNAPERDWPALLEAAADELSGIVVEMSGVEEALRDRRARLVGPQARLAVLSVDDVTSPADVARWRSCAERARATEASSRSTLDELGVRSATVDQDIVRVSREVSGIPFEDLLGRSKALGSMGQELIQMRHAHERGVSMLRSQERSAEKLKQVPCGDTFPSCMYIRESHQDRSRMEAQRESVDAMRLSLETLEASHRTLSQQGIQDQLELQRHRDLRAEASRLEFEGAQLTQRIGHQRRDVEKSTDERIIAEDTLRDVLARVTVDRSPEIEGLKHQVALLEAEVRDLDDRRLHLASRRGSLTSEVQRLELEQEEHERLRIEWRLYETFVGATSKKGVPSRVIQAQLPIINAEIARILHGVVDYTLQVEKDPESSSTDIYIDYGDSRRLIELGSGMEKMISSLAIRVALQNASTLPKPDFFIIDEGFGTLDETNVEACNRLLVSLKRWFKHIIVISHIDGIKDITDNVIEISRRGSDAYVNLGG